MEGWGSKRAAFQLDLHSNKIPDFPLRSFISEMWKYIMLAYKAVNKVHANTWIQALPC